MGGSKTVNAQQYLSKPDSSRDLAIQMAMQQAQAQQQATQAKLLDTYARMAPAQQEYDAAAESKRLAELGMANVQRSREMEKMVSPEAAQMRQAQGAERGADADRRREHYRRPVCRAVRVEKPE